MGFGVLLESFGCWLRCSTQAGGCLVAAGFFSAAGFVLLMLAGEEERLKNDG
uniref:Uncharacterized protein n=1 Tax=Solanum lycopersicum TaxID=4081 RepID=A0A3Q7GRT3_SOLLC